jgi:hypothetical protein
MLDRSAARIEGGREELARLFLIRIQDCSRYCVVISHPSQKPRVLEIAIRTAIARRGVDHGNVLLLLGTDFPSIW